MYLFCIINTHFGKYISYGYFRFYSVTEKLHFVGWISLSIYFPFVVCIFHEQVLYVVVFLNVTCSLLASLMAVFRTLMFL